MEIHEPTPAFDFRRSVDLRLDREGRWYHDGQPFAHPRLIALFDQGIDLHPETGEPILRVGDKWCYIRADDTPFVVRRLRQADGALFAELNTGEAVAVPAEGFEEGPAGALYVRADERRRARLTRAAQAALAEHLQEAGEGLRVRIGGRDYPVRLSGRR